MESKGKRSELKKKHPLGLVSWLLDCGAECQHAEDSPMATWGPHISERDVQNMGLFHVHSQEASTDGKCVSLYSSIHFSRLIVESAKVAPTGEKLWWVIATSGAVLGTQDLR